MSAYQTGACHCQHCDERRRLMRHWPTLQRPIFTTKIDAFVWGALVGAILIGLAAIVGRVLWQLVA